MLPPDGLLLHTPQADIVTSITFVDGCGRINTVDRNSLVGRGLAGGVGMLGIITEVTLQLKPGLSKAKVFAIGPKPDADIAQEFKNLIVSGCSDRASGSLRDWEQAVRLGSDVSRFRGQEESWRREAFTAACWEFEYCSPWIECSNTSPPLQRACAVLNVVTACLGYCPG